MSGWRLPAWTGVVIGLLAGALVGALLLLVNERTLRSRWEHSLTAREQSLREMVAANQPDTTRQASSPNLRRHSVSVTRRYGELAYWASPASAA